MHYAPSERTIKFWRKRNENQENFCTDPDDCDGALSGGLRNEGDYPSDDGQNPTEQTDPNKISISSKKIISLGGGVSGGTFAMLGAGMASVITNHVENLSVNCEGTSGSVEACKLVGAGDLALRSAPPMPSILRRLAPVPSRALLLMAFVLLWAVTAPRSMSSFARIPTLTLADLKGKAYYLPPPAIPFRTSFRSLWKPTVTGLTTIPRFPEPE